jgi:hypothetical protein
MKAFKCIATSRKVVEENPTSLVPAGLNLLMATCCFKCIKITINQLSVIHLSVYHKPVAYQYYFCDNCLYSLLTFQHEPYVPSPSNRMSLNRFIKQIGARCVLHNREAVRSHCMDSGKEKGSVVTCCSLLSILDQDLVFCWIFFSFFRRSSSPPPLSLFIHCTIIV